jgi:hypothetical protein
MIQRKPCNRLGVNGPEEVKDHPWLAKVDWDAYLEHRIDSLYKINVVTYKSINFQYGADNFDSKFVNMKEDHEVDAEL